MGKEEKKRIVPDDAKYSHKYHKPRQEISPILKYLLFFTNFIFFLCGLASIGLGVYIWSVEETGIQAIGDIFLNPAILFNILGLIIAAISLFGCMGALRDNVCLLKTFALSIFVSYIFLVISTFLLFLLFYSDTRTGLSIQSILVTAVEQYSANPNYRDFMDYIQATLECCGASARGYKDYGQTDQFNCSDQNHLPEKCGVPYSCCLPEATKKFQPIQCWKDAQRKSITEVQDHIYTEGCLVPLQEAFESRAVLIGAAVGAIIIPVCLAVTLSNVLSKQIEHQRYLLEREARREEKRKKRMKHRFRDPFARNFTLNRRRNNRSDYLGTIDETNELSPQVQQRSGHDNLHELRATHLTQDIILGRGSSINNQNNSNTANHNQESSTSSSNNINHRGENNARVNGDRRRTKGGESVRGERVRNQQAEQESQSRKTGPSSSLSSQGQHQQRASTRREQEEERRRRRTSPTKQPTSSSSSSSYHQNPRQHSAKHSERRKDSERALIHDVDNNNTESSSKIGKNNDTNSKPSSSNNKNPSPSTNNLPSSSSNPKNPNHRSSSPSKPSKSSSSTSTPNSGLKIVEVTEEEEEEEAGIKQ